MDSVRVIGRVLTAIIVVGSLSANAAPPAPHHRHATLDARIGLGSVDQRNFDALAMYLGISTFYFGLGFYEEASVRKAEDSMGFEGLLLEGVRSTRTLQVPFVFGSEIYRRPDRWLDIRMDAQFKGGLELEFSHLKTDEGSRIPGSPNTNYFLGFGLRTQFIHPFKPWLGTELKLFSSMYIGLSAEADLLFRQLEIEDVPESSFLSVLGFIVIGSKKLAIL